MNAKDNNAVVTVNKDETKLTIEIDLSKNLGRDSGSGKSVMIASSGGFAKVSTAKFGAFDVSLNVIQKKAKA